MKLFAEIEAALLELAQALASTTAKFAEAVGRRQASVERLPRVVLQSYEESIRNDDFAMHTEEIPQNKQSAVDIQITAETHPSIRLNCPICKTQSLHMDGVAARCPACGSTSYERLLRLYLQKKTRLYGLRHTVLVLEPTKGMHSLLQTIEKLEIVESSVGSLLSRNSGEEYASGKFDAVISSYDFTSSERDFAALTELVRIIKPGGWLLTAAHSSFYMENAGFTVFQDKFAATLGDDIVQYLGIDKTQTTHFCLKPASPSQLHENKGHIAEGQLQTQNGERTYVRTRHGLPTSASSVGFMTSAAVGKKQ